MAFENKKVTVADELDVLDDDLLDEVLDDFSSQPPTKSSSPTFSTINNSIPSNLLPKLTELTSDMDEEYAKILAAEMEKLVDEVTNKELNEELKSTLQGFMKSVGGINNLNDIVDFDGKNSIIGDVSGNKIRKSPNESKGDSFQDKINQTMNKLQNSSEQVDASITEESTDILMEEMLKHLENMGLTEDNIDGMCGGMDKIMESMMGTLASKEYLYEPMKEFHKKYSKWLNEKYGKVSQIDYENFKKQSDCIKKIIEEYESPDFDSNNEQQNKVIVNLMQELQELGQPPPEIIQDFAPDLSFDENGLPNLSNADLPSNCKPIKPTKFKRGQSTRMFEELEDERASAYEDFMNKYAQSWVIFTDKHREMEKMEVITMIILNEADFYQNLTNKNKSLSLQLDNMNREIDIL
ncbi:22684_t:CDS:2 [Entrophospora sp. SA101]|nr:22684_t:CDS:2 [Entrophospora sp. SA101]